MNANEIPITQAMKQTLKYRRETSLIVLGLSFSKLRSTSYFAQREMKAPGITMSPSPKRLNDPSLGNIILMGISIFCATVTITSVPQTQNRSQKKRSQRSVNPTLNDCRLRNFMAFIAKKMAQILLRSQCLEKQKRMIGAVHATLEMIKAGLTTILVSLHILFIAGWSWIQMSVLFRDSQVQSWDRIILVVVMTADRLKSRMRIELRIYFPVNLQSRCIPIRKALPINGNLKASSILKEESWGLLARSALFSCLVTILIERIAPTYTHPQESTSNWNQTGGRCTKAKMFVTIRARMGR